MDGANSGISFSDTGELLLQSRGHYLTGGPREKHFSLFKTWANRYRNELYELLGSRYLMYGEWLYAKHTVFYDALPNYFMEFDIYDKEKQEFLSTPRRMQLMEGFDFIAPVKILFEGHLLDITALHGLVTRSHFITPDSKSTLRKLAAQQALNIVQIQQETDSSELMEGLYIKVEEEGVVKERYKFVRADFLTAVMQSESHWLDRPIIANQLQAGIELF